MEHDSQKKTSCRRGFRRAVGPHSKEVRARRAKVKHLFWTANCTAAMTKVHYRGQARNRQQLTLLRVSFIRQSRLAPSFPRGLSDQKPAVCLAGVHDIDHPESDRDVSMLHFLLAQGTQTPEEGPLGSPERAFRGYRAIPLLFCQSLFPSALLEVRQSRVFQSRRKREVSMYWMGSSSSLYS